MGIFEKFDVSNIIILYLYILFIIYYIIYYRYNTIYYILYIYILFVSLVYIANEMMLLRTLFLSSNTPFPSFSRSLLSKSFVRARMSRKENHGKCCVEAAM